MKDQNGNDIKIVLPADGTLSLLWRGHTITISPEDRQRLLVALGE